MANNKNQKTKNYVAAAMGIAAGAMIYKKTHTACGQCGSKISGKQYKIKPHGEDERVAASLAGVNPHKRYDADCYDKLSSDFNTYKKRADNYENVRTYSINYRGHTHSNGCKGGPYSTTGYADRNDAEDTIRKVAAVCGGDTVTNLKFDRDESREWKASGTICRSDDKRHKANSGKTRRNK